MWAHVALSLSKKQYQVKSKHIPTWRGKGVRVALMEAAGEMLQHSLSLLGLSYQYNHFQKRPKRRKPNKKE